MDDYRVKQEVIDKLKVEQVNVRSLCWIPLAREEGGRNVIYDYVTPAQETSQNFDYSVSKKAQGDALLTILNERRDEFGNIMPSMVTYSVFTQGEDGEPIRSLRIFPASLNHRQAVNIMDLAV